MGPVSTETEIDAPRERVFDFVADYANRPAFMDHFASDMRLSSLDSSGVGAGARFRFFAAPQAVWVDSAIVEVADPSRIVEQGHGGRFNRIPTRIVWEFEPGTGPMSLVRVTYWTETTHAVDRLRDVLGGASIWYERNWRIALRRLRDLLEDGGGGSERLGVGGGNRVATGVP